MKTYTKLFIASVIILILGFVGMVICNMCGIFTVSSYVMKSAFFVAIVIVIIAFCNIIYTEKKDNGKQPTWIIFVIIFIALIIVVNIVKKRTDERVAGEIERELFTNTVTTNNTQSTITMEMFNKISDNMTYKQVCNIIGFEGTLSSQSGTMKIYTWEKSERVISIAFIDNKVVSKAQTGL